MSDHQKRETVSLEQMTYSNMLTINALVELLDERGIQPRKDVLERIEALQAGIQRQQQQELYLLVRVTLAGLELLKEKRPPVYEGIAKSAE